MPLTLPWCVGTGITAAWFGYFAPASLARVAQKHPISPAFKAHLFCAVSTTLVCVWNLWKTPSEGELYRKVHKLLGRYAGICSILGTAFGYVAAWTDVGVPRGTAIGLSVVGVLQFKATFKGWRAIRQAQFSKAEERKALIHEHRVQMNTLFYGCCLGPAWFRIPKWLGLAKGPGVPLWVQIAGVLPPFAILPMAIRTSRDRTFV